MFGMSAVVLALILGKRLLGTTFGLFLGVITAVSPALISQSLQLKQYSADLFCAFLMMILIWDYSQDPSRRNFLWLLAATLVCVPLSYATVMFLPLAACIIFLTDASNTRSLRRTMIFVLLTALVFLTLRTLYIKPNQSPELVDYWYRQGAFREKGSGIAIFYLSRFRQAFWMFYGTAIVARVLGVLAVFGVGALFYSINTARSRVLLAMSGVPVLTLLVLNALNLYPFYHENVDTFLFPCLAVTSFLGLMVVAQLASRIGGKRTFLELIPKVLCAAAFLIAMRSDLGRPPKSSPEDPGSAVRYLQRTARTGDLIYVHASAEEQTKLYMRLLEVDGLPIVFGNTGWPCCTRHHQFETGQVSDDYVMADFEKQIAAIHPKELLLVFADRPANWEWVGRNERQIILQHEEKICQHVNTYFAARIVIDDLRCNFLQ